MHTARRTPLLLGALLMTLSTSAWAGTATIRLDAGGQLLDALPQIDRGDRVRFVVEPTRDAQQAERASFELVWSCGEGDGWREERLALQPTPAAYEATLPARCTASRTIIRWELEGRRTRDLLPQRYLHRAGRALGWLNETALLCLGRGDCDTAGTAAYRARRDKQIEEAMVVADGVFAEVSRRPEGDSARAAFEDVFALPVGGGAVFGAALREALRQRQDGSWESLARASAAPFAPYADAWRDELEFPLADLDDALDLVDEAEAGGGLGSSPDLQVVADAIAAAGGPLIGHETPGESARRYLLEGRRRLTAAFEARFLKPAVWLSSGSVPVGFHQRVITIDVDGDADTADLPINRLDTVWVALANTSGEEWSVSLLSTESLDDVGALYPDAFFTAERGDGEVLVAPQLNLRTAAPLRRVILRDHGKQPGHTNAVFTATSEDGTSKSTNPFYVRRTWNIGFKTAFVYSHFKDRQFELLTDSDQRLIFNDGLPRVARTEPDGRAEVVLGLAIHLYPMDLQDGARRPAWARFLPHVLVGWAPTDWRRLYAGGGWEPINGVSIEGGVAVGPRSVLKAPPLGYGTGWAVEQEPAVGWYLGIAGDASLIARLFSTMASRNAPTRQYGTWLGGVGQPRNSHRGGHP